MQRTLKKSQVKPRKKIEREQIKGICPEKKTKKITKTYKRVLTTFITVKQKNTPKNLFLVFVLGFCPIYAKSKPNLTLVKNSIFPSCC